MIWIICVTACKKVFTCERKGLFTFFNGKACDVLCSVPYKQHNFSKLRAQNFVFPYKDDVN